MTTSNIGEPPALGEATVQELRGSLRGELVLPGDDGGWLRTVTPDVGRPSVSASFSSGSFTPLIDRIGHSINP